IPPSGFQKDINGYIYQITGSENCDVNLVRRAAGDPTVMVTDCSGNAHTVTCTTSEQTSPFRFYETSCSMPPYLVGSFGPIYKTGIYINGEWYTYTETNYVAPSVTCDTRSTVTNVAGVTGVASCSYGDTTVSVGESATIVLTISCSMPPELSSAKFTTTVSTVTLGDPNPTVVSITNTNLPSFADVPFTTTVIDLTGDILTQTCKKQFTTINFAGTTSHVITTSCSFDDSQEETIGTYISETSVTTVTYQNEPFIFTITNFNVASFSPLYTSVPVTNPTGEVGEATCAIQFTSTSVNNQIVSIPTTSCTMPSNIQGEFAEATSVVDEEYTVTNFI
ncbi:hypothetical protein CANINC_001569, partial [Pichia inconspicua]